MAQKTKLVNIGKSFEKLKLILDLEENANENTLTGIAILKAFRDKKTPNEEILRYVKDQAKDCPETMYNCIGEELTNRILDFKL